MQVHAVQVGVRRKCVYAAFKDQRHQECLDDVVNMMRVGDFITAETLDFVVERTFAHFRAEGTGIGFFTLVENNLKDVGFHNVIWYIEFCTQISDLGCVEVR